MARVDAWIVGGALLLASATALAAGLALDGYAHGTYPLGLLGARGVPGAPAVNALLYALPGAAVAWLAWAWRGQDRFRGSLPTRFALQGLLISAAAHVAQGLLPLDPGDLDATPSRLHAAAWTLWWIAAALAMACAALAALRARPARVETAVAWAAAAVGLALLAASSLTPLPPPSAQRLALVGWFVAVLVVAWRMPGPPR